jgi:hypothetical protein
MVLDEHAENQFCSEKCMKAFFAKYGEAFK